MSLVMVEPVDFYCPACDSALLATGCLSAMCTGYRCDICKTGCDWGRDNSACANRLLHAPFTLAHIPGGDRW